MKDSEKKEVSLLTSGKPQFHYEEKKKKHQISKN